MPSACSTPAMRSESCSFIWHPKVRIRYRRSIGPRLLPGELRGAGLTNDRDADLPGVLQLLLHLLRDIACHHLRLEVVDLLRRDHHPNLAPGLHRERLLDAGVSVADLLEPFEALHVGLERFSPRARPAPRDRIGDLGEHRVYRVLLDLPVMGFDAVNDLGILLQAA